jgi:hypothetical protein
MTEPDRPLPRAWNRKELAVQRERAISEFISWWKEKGAAAYHAHFSNAQLLVDRLFRNTDNP